VNNKAKEILEKLYDMNDVNEIDEISDYLFESIDDLHLEGRFDIVDEIIENINLSKFNNYFLVGLLSITFPARSKLKNRTSMVNRIEYQFELRCPNRIPELIGGLR